ncbi:MAG: DUF2247 family protein, partial [Vulcanimicrobiota bacterium]
HFPPPEAKFSSNRSTIPQKIPLQEEKNVLRLARNAKCPQALVWLFKNRADFSDPFAELDKLYADFDYPASIEHLVSFMPTSEGYNPSKHTIEENQKRLLDLWSQFLKDEKSRLLNIRR